MYSVGGWTAGGWIFSMMAETAENREKFIKSAIHFIRYFGLDGLDVDWEFPGFDMLPEVPTNPADREHFTLLIRELHAVFIHHSRCTVDKFARIAQPGLNLNFLILMLSLSLIHI